MILNPDLLAAPRARPKSTQAGKGLYVISWKRACFSRRVPRAGNRLMLTNYSRDAAAGEPIRHWHRSACVGETALNDERLRRVMMSYYAESSMHFCFDLKTNLQFA